jgi:hypothetical protein
MRSEFYRQCELFRKISGDLEEKMVSWIPEEKAKVNNIVRLRNSSEEEWSEGWLVVAVYGKRSYAELETTERDWTKQRKASDI